MEHSASNSHTMVTEDEVIGESIFGKMDPDFESHIIHLIQMNGRERATSSYADDSTFVP